MASRFVVVDEEAGGGGVGGVSSECAALSNVSSCPEFPSLRDIVLEPINQRVNDIISVINRIPVWFNYNAMRGSTALSSRLYAMGDALGGNEGSNQFFTDEGLADIEALQASAPATVIDQLLTYAAEVKKQPLETRAQFIINTFPQTFLSEGAT